MPNRKPTQPLRIPIPVPGGLPTASAWADVPKVDHPGLVESFVPVWGSEKEAIADYYDGDSAGAVGNSLLAATDLIPGKAFGGVVAKGGFKLASKSWKYQRRLMGKAGQIARGDHGHHWLLAQNGIAKALPPQVKNMGFNILPMKPADHMRVHGRYKGLPKFGPLQQFFIGTPLGFQLGVANAAGHVLSQVDSRTKGPDRR